MGLPIINIMLHVLAATNSATKYGIGLILLSLQKKIMNGVSVNITTSLEVNIVSTAVKKYNKKNRLNWLVFATDAARFAKNLNKPTSSKKIDKKVIEKNRTSNFKGLIESFLVNPSHTSSNGNNKQIINAAAPKRATIQYVPIFNLPILKLGKNRRVANKATKVTQAIINVAIIYLMN